MQNLRYHGVHPTVVAFRATEHLCRLDLILADWFHLCYLLRAVDLLERESLSKGRKRFWVVPKVWKDCLDAAAAEQGSTVYALERGVVKLTHPDLFASLATWELRVHGAERQRVEAEYRQALTTFAAIVKVRLLGPRRCS